MVQFSKYHRNYLFFLESDRIWKMNKWMNEQTDKQTPLSSWKPCKVGMIIATLLSEDDTETEWPRRSKELTWGRIKFKPTLSQSTVLSTPSQVDLESNPVFYVIITDSHLGALGNALNWQTVSGTDPCWVMEKYWKRRMSHSFHGTLLRLRFH